MTWDHLDRVLWIGGAQWAGKTSVAQLLAVRHPLILYAYDYHDARSHAERSLASPERFPNRYAYLTTLERDPDALWVRPSPEEMAESALLSFRERFEMVLEDIAALPPGAPVLAEGWGLRPELVAPYLRSSRQAIFLVPGDQFLQRQIEIVARAAGFNPDFRVSDPARAQHNRLARNRLLARDVVDSAERLGLRVLIVDGSLDLVDVVALVEEHFRALLPRWRY
jgi:hypothetical protein